MENFYETTSKQNLISHKEGYEKYLKSKNIYDYIWKELDDKKNNIYLTNIDVIAQWQKNNDVYHNFLECKTENYDKNMCAEAFNININNLNFKFELPLDTPIVPGKMSHYFALKLFDDVRNLTHKAKISWPFSQSICENHRMSILLKENYYILNTLLYNVWIEDNYKKYPIVFKKSYLGDSEWITMIFLIPIKEIPDYTIEYKDIVLSF